jgi:hypothetical protein
VPCARNPPPPRPLRSVASGGRASGDGLADCGSHRGGGPGGEGSAHSRDGSSRDGGASGEFLGSQAWAGGSSSQGGGVPPPGASRGRVSFETQSSLGSRAPPQRWVCLQFRSGSSPAAMAMAPVISIPPTLMTQPDRHNYYWVTVDESAVPAAPVTPGHDGGTGAGAWSSHSQSELSASYRGGGGGGPGEPLLQVYGGGGPSSSGTGATRPGGASDGGGSDAPATPPRITAFNLLPEDNPFQDITIGSLLGWGSYGRVHRGEAAGRRRPRGGGGPGLWLRV